MEKFLKKLTYFKMRHFTAQISKECYKIPCSDHITVKEACFIVQNQFSLHEQLEARIYGTRMIPSKLLYKYCLQDDPIIFTGPNGRPIQTNIKKRNISNIPNNKWRVFFATEYSKMINGVDLDIKNEFGVVKTKEVIKNHLKIAIGNDTFDVIIYLPGGIVFRNGTLYDFLDEFPNAYKHLYVTLYPTKINPSFLWKPIDIVCNSVEKNFVSALSPLFESTQMSLDVAASILGFLSFCGKGSEIILSYFSMNCYFSPFIVGLWKLVNRQTIEGHQLVTISECFLSIFKAISKDAIPNESLWSNSTIFLTPFAKDTPEIEIHILHYSQPYMDSVLTEKYLKKFCNESQDTAIYIPEVNGDVDSGLVRNLPDLNTCISAYNNDHDKLFHHYKVMSLRSMGTPCLFTCNDGSALFVNNCAMKTSNDLDKINVIYPRLGTIVHDTIENIAMGVKEEEIRVIQKNPLPPSQPKLPSPIANNPSQHKNSPIPPNLPPLSVIKPSKVLIPIHSFDLVEKSDVQQIIIICIDESYSMIEPFDQDFARYSAAAQMLSSICSKAYAYRCSSTFGIISFEKEVTTLMELCEIPQTFESVISGIKPKRSTALYKGIDLAISKIINVAPHYKNAIKRIVVLSDGKDTCGGINPIEIFKKLLENEIVLDAITINIEDTDNDLKLAAHFTGGVMFFPQNTNEGIDMCSHDGFINPNLRQFRKPFKASDISQNIVNVTRNALKDQKDMSITLKKIDQAPSVIVPTIAIDSGSKMSEYSVSNRLQSIVKQLKSIHNNKPNFFEVYVDDKSVDKWRVLFWVVDPRSLYINCYWDLQIDFPIQYPKNAPEIRFLTVPYHVNITENGRICIDTLHEQYNASKSIESILKDIHDLLQKPNYLSPVDNSRCEFIDLSKPNGVDIALQNKYSNKIQEYNQRAIKNKDAYIKNWRINREDSHIHIEKDVVIPPEFIDPWSNQVIKQVVKLKCGTLRDRDTLIQQFRLSNTFDTSSGERVKSIKDHRTGAMIRDQQNWVIDTQKQLELDNLLKNKPI